ncbi:Satratoxin biosynthesis SC1 cluster protein 4 [Cladorrhinum sp. PSN332]|nr:Satratoxin biosynthesis SC1 cluster protein 4 [Cladorrhinum sp. PSN332]
MWYIGDIPIVERNYGLAASGFAFITLSFVIISMRVYTRAVMLNSLGVDDILIVVGFLCEVSSLVVTIEQLRYGLGSTVDPGELVGFLKMLYATIITYSVTQMFIKLSILFQYRRIFQTPAAKKLTMGVLCWFAVYGIACVGTSIFTCWPVAKFWNVSIDGVCMHRPTLHYCLAAFNIFNDFLLLFLPVPWLRGLNVSRQVKVVLIGVFACGAFACIVGIIRLRSLYLFQTTPIEEQPVHGVDIAIWSSVELNVAMICASVPPLKALFVKIMPSLSLRTLSGDKSKADNTIGGIMPSTGKRSSRKNSIPLRSFGNNNNKSNSTAAVRALGGGGLSGSEADLEVGVTGMGALGGGGRNGGMEIKVSKSFEMRTITSQVDEVEEEEGSEKDLVVTKSKAEVFDENPNRQGGGGRRGS